MGFACGCEPESVVFLKIYVNESLIFYEIPNDTQGWERSISNEKQEKIDFIVILLKFRELTSYPGPQLLAWGMVMIYNLWALLEIFPQAICWLPTLNMKPTYALRLYYKVNKKYSDGLTLLLYACFFVHARPMYIIKLRGGWLYYMIIWFANLQVACFCKPYYIDT